MTPDQKSDTMKHLAEATPAALAVVVPKALGVSWSDGAAIAGILFICLQAAYLLWRWRRDIVRERARVARLEVDSDTGDEGGWPCN